MTNFTQLILLAGNVLKLFFKIKIYILKIHLHVWETYNHLYIFKWKAFNFFKKKAFSSFSIAALR